MATTLPLPADPIARSPSPSRNSDVFMTVPDEYSGAAREKEEGRSWIARKAGNTLPGRFLESALSTSKSTVTSVSCISPWGDNNPVVLPCIRVRDVALIGLVAFTGGLAAPAGAIFAGPGAYFVAAPVAGQIVGEVVGGAVREEVVELAMKKGLDLAFDKKELANMLTTDDVITLEVTLKHTLAHDTAELSFYHARSGVPESQSSSSSTLKTLKAMMGDPNAIKAYFDYSKEWFSPYLMATQRTPAIPRSEYPAAILSHGPFIEADYLFAHQILASTPSLIPFCEPSPDVDVPCARMLIGFVGIAPYRSIWTSSRRPEEAKLVVHLANGVPGLVLPVLPGTPYQLWSTLPLLAVLKLPEPSSPELDAHIGAISALLCSLVDWDNFKLPATSSSNTTAPSRDEKEAALVRALELVFEGMRLPKDVKVVKKAVDAERAGMVGLRFGNRSLFAKEEGKGGLLSGLKEGRGGGQSGRGRGGQDPEGESGRGHGGRGARGRGGRGRGRGG